MCTLTTILIDFKVRAMFLRYPDYSASDNLEKSG